MSSDRILDALAFGLIAGAGATALGALPAWFLRDLSPRARAALAGVAAGIMLAATFFSLLGPGLALSIERFGRPVGVATAAGALIAGALFVAVLRRCVPHGRVAKGVEREHRAALARTWLFVIAIAVHNFPEGLAIGVGAGSGERSLAMPIAIAIGLQNLPEGFVVAASLVSVGYPRGRAIAMASLTGVVEVVGALLGAAALIVSHGLLPVALCFSAGAMLFVISDEVLPGAHRGEHAPTATRGVIAGFVIMMLLDSAFA